MVWDFSDLTKRLKETVENSGLTVTELSQKTGISVRTLKDYLAGKRYPHAGRLMKISNALGVSCDYLLFPDRIN
ncbi:MAG: helix-turn-helix domain-containing protein [Clostridia bacterium]|nr:helix-turn-helix domain-containing protein [Clostridia bacterium]